MIRLEQIHIPAPCSQSWEAMTGEEQARFCEHCQKSVHNLSAMTRPEAERLVTRLGGNLCVRIEARADGSIITREVPTKTGLARRGVFANVSYAAALLLSCGASLVQSGGKAAAAPVGEHSRPAHRRRHIIVDYPPLPPPPPQFAGEDIPPPPNAPAPDLLPMPPIVVRNQGSSLETVIISGGIGYFPPPRPRHNWWLRISWPIRVSKAAGPETKAAEREQREAPGQRRPEG